MYNSEIKVEKRFKGNFYVCKVRGQDEILSLKELRKLSDNLDYRGIYLCNKKVLDEFSSIDSVDITKDKRCYGDVDYSWRGKSLKSLKWEYGNNQPKILYELANYLSNAESSEIYNAYFIAGVVKYLIDRNTYKMHAEMRSFLCGVYFKITRYFEENKMYYWENCWKGTLPFYLDGIIDKKYTMGGDYLKLSLLDNGARKFYYMIRDMKESLQKEYEVVHFLYNEIL